MLRPGEFTGLDEDETRRAVHAGWRVLKLAGIEPDGFVAPSYAYTTALREALKQRFAWWAGLLRVHRVSRDVRFGALAAHARLQPRGGGPIARAAAPPLLRVGSLLPTSSLRLDLHPCDLASPRHMLALEWVLSRNGERRAVTYRELAGV